MKCIFYPFMKTIPIAALLMLMSCQKSENTNTAPPVQPINVSVMQLRPSRILDAIQVTGTVKAYEDVLLSTEEGGVVKTWVKHKGQRVAKGEVIALLKDEVLKASYEAAEAQSKMADLNVEKQQKVYEQQGISELQFKTLGYTRDAARANAELMKARFERTHVKSPIIGILDDTFYDEGEFAPPGVPIARIVNLGLAKIQAEVPEMYAGSIKRGDRAMVTLDASLGDTLRSVLTFVSSTVSSANRALTVELVLPNVGRKMKPEMVAKVHIVRGMRSNVLVITENIVQLVDRDRRIVFVVSKDKAEERQVVLGARQGNAVEIVSGLREGDLVVTAGYQRLVHGQPVTIIK